MPTCCGADAYAKLFDEKNAKKDLRRYLKSGLDATGRRIVDAIINRGVVGTTVLEVGGGIGAIQVELLRAGALRATNVEIVDTYESAAGHLLATVGLAERVDRKVLDFAESGPEIAGADVVVLHRVICCYPGHGSSGARCHDPRWPPAGSQLPARSLVVANRRAARHRLVPDSWLRLPHLHTRSAPDPGGCGLRGLPPRPRAPRIDLAGRGAGAFGLISNQQRSEERADVKVIAESPETYRGVTPRGGPSQ